MERPAVQRDQPDDRTGRASGRSRRFGRCGAARRRRAAGRGDQLCRYLRREGRRGTACGCSRGDLSVLSAGRLCRELPFALLPDARFQGGGRACGRDGEGPFACGCAGRSRRSGRHVAVSARLSRRIGRRRTETRAAAADLPARDGRGIADRAHREGRTRCVGRPERHLLQGGAGQGVAAESPLRVESQ